MGSAPGAGLSEEKPRMKRVPKGTSAYQAAWIVDDYDDDEDDDEDEEDDDEMAEGDEEVEGQRNAAEEEEEEEETEEIELDSRRSEVHKDLDPEQEERE